MVSFDLTGKWTIVPGSTMGLGRGIAEGLLGAGAEVVIAGSYPKALKVVAEYSGKGFLCHDVASDLGDREKLIDGFEESFDKLGENLDIFVNVAGIQLCHFCKEFPIEDWDAVIEVNFMLCLCFES